MSNSIKLGTSRVWSYDVEDQKTAPVPLRSPGAKRVAPLRAIPSRFNGPSGPVTLRTTHPDLGPDREIYFLSVSSNTTILKKKKKGGGKEKENTSEPDR